MGDVRGRHAVGPDADDGPTEEDLAELMDLERAFPARGSSFVRPGEASLRRGPYQIPRFGAAPTYLPGQGFNEQHRRNITEKRIDDLVTEILNRLKAFSCFEKVKRLFLQAYTLLKDEAKRGTDGKKQQELSGRSEAVSGWQNVRLDIFAKTLVMVCIFAVLKPIRPDLTVEQISALSGTGPEGFVNVKHIQLYLQRLESLLEGTLLPEVSRDSPAIYLKQHFAFLRRQMSLRVATPGYGLTSPYARRKPRFEDGKMEEEESVMSAKDHQFLAMANIERAQELASALSLLCEQEGLTNRASTLTPIRDLSVCAWAIIVLSLEASTNRIVGRPHHQLASVMIYLGGWSLGTKGKGMTKAELGLLNEGEEYRDEDVAALVIDQDHEDGELNQIDDFGIPVSQDDKIRSAVRLNLTKMVQRRSKQMNRMITTLSAHLPWLSSIVNLEKRLPKVKRAATDDEVVRHHLKGDQASLAALPTAEMSRCLPDVILFVDLLRQRRAWQQEQQGQRKAQNLPHSIAGALDQQSLPRADLLDIIRTPVALGESQSQMAPNDLQARDMASEKPIHARWISLFGTVQDQSASQMRKWRSRLDAGVLSRSLLEQETKIQDDLSWRIHDRAEPMSKWGNDREDSPEDYHSVKVYEAVTSCLFDHGGVEKQSGDDAVEKASPLAQRLCNSHFLRTEGALENMLDSVVDSVLFQPDEMDSYLRGVKEGETEEVEMVRNLRWDEWVEGEKLCEEMEKRKERETKRDKRGEPGGAVGTTKLTKGELARRRLTEILEAEDDKEAAVGTERDISQSNKRQKTPSTTQRKLRKRS